MNCLKAYQFSKCTYLDTTRRRHSHLPTTVIPVHLAHSYTSRPDNNIQDRRGRRARSGHVDRSSTPRRSQCSRIFSAMRWCSRMSQGDTVQGQTHLFRIARERHGVDDRSCRPIGMQTGTVVRRGGALHNMLIISKTCHVQHKRILTLRDQLHIVHTPTRKMASPPPLAGNPP